MKACIIYLSAYLALSTLNSCKKFIDVGVPKDQIVSERVFEEEVTAISALTGLYSKMMQDFGGSFGNYKITLFCGLAADELRNYSTSSNQAEFFLNGLTVSNSNLLNLWRDAYNYIYTTNSIVEGIENSKNLSLKAKERLKGESLFVRAFCHLYLANLFGDIPYIRTTNYNNNSSVSRTPISDVYKMIIEDLIESEKLLTPEYVNPDFSMTSDRVRPNKWAAAALLARVYLYSENWSNAEDKATQVIEQKSLYNLVDLDDVFLKGSNEAIFQLMPVYSGYNTWEGNGFILTSSPTNVTVSNQLLDSFETNDKRKTSWIDSIKIITQTYYYPNKYKIKSSTSISEYYTILRLAEQYLIRAEARARRNNFTGSIDDLNAIRTRAGLEARNSMTQSEILSYIEHERHMELFVEWGHRWQDLKRTNRAASVLGKIKPGWQDSDVLFPIPQTERLNNNNLTQNLGY